MEPTSVTRIGLLLVRPGTLVAASPLFGGPFAPAQLKVGLTLLLAAVLLPSVAVPPADGSATLLLIVMRETAIGLALGLAIQALVAAAELAGHLAGFQMGLSYGALVDPQSGVRHNVLAVLYANIALLTLFLTNGHHAFLRALDDSYRTLPIGVGGIDGSLAGAVMSMLGLIFTLGTRLAAPVVVVMVVTELAMALLARSAPALNLPAAGSTVRLIVGLMVLAIVVPVVVSVIAGAGDSVLRLGAEAAKAFR